jgi:hypothetical protein
LTILSLAYQLPCKVIGQTLSAGTRSEARSALVGRFFDRRGTMVDSEYLSAVSESCEGAVVGLGRISKILFDGAIESLDLTSAAWDGDALVSDAASAFEEYQEALIWGAAVATAFPTNPEVGGASVFAAELGEALSSLLMNSTYLIGSVFDEDAGTIDSGAYNTSVVEMRSSLFPLVTMSHVSPDSYC